MNRKRILHGLGVVVLLALVVPFVIHAVPAVVGADHSYVILSGSMEPEMSTGDSVIVEERDSSSIEEGDVITFSRAGSDTVVTHRVVDVREENGQLLFETKGDANEAADREPVPARNVVGTVTLTIPLIGYVIHFVNSPAGFATMVLLPLGLLVVSEAWAFVRSASDDADERGGESDAAGERSTEDGASVAPGARGSGSGGESTLVGTPAEDSADVGEIAERSTAPGTWVAVPSADESAASETGGDADGVVVDATDLVATTVLLALLTPYTVYVALQLQTLVTIAIAYTVGFTALSLGAIHAAAWLRSLHRREWELGSTTSGNDTERIGDVGTTETGEEQDDGDEEVLDESEVEGREGSRGETLEEDAEGQGEFDWQTGSDSDSANGLPGNDPPPESEDAIAEWTPAFDWGDDTRGSESGGES